MTPRVLIPLLLFATVAVSAILIPTGNAIAVSRTQQVTLQRISSLDLIIQRTDAALTQHDIGPLRDYLDRFHDTYRESVSVIDDAENVVLSVGKIPMDADTTAVIRAAARAVPQRSLRTVYPWSPTTAVIAEPFTIGGTTTVGVVALAVDLTAAKTDVLRSWLVLAAAGFILLAALSLAAWRWTVWVLRPVRSLDQAASALAEHREHTSTVHSGPPELQRLSATFDRMTRAVEESLAQQRGFVADASHQLRNPLAAIRLRIDSLTSASPRTDELGAVDNDLRRLEAIVERMLVLANTEHSATARSSSGDERIPSCSISGQELVRPHISALTAIGISILGAPTAEIDVPCDRDDLEAIVEILLDNARKYAGSGSVVRLSLDREADTIELRVEDSGNGLDDDALEAIGTRFWRAPEHSGLPGTGLGVAIVKELARANNASLGFGRSPLGGLAVTMAWARS